MATHAAALHEQIATEIQRLRTLRDAIFRVTLLAPGLRVLFFKHRPEPETMAPVSFDVAGGRTAVTPVTTGTTKLLRIVNLKYFAVRMAYKRARETVGLTTWTNKTRRCQLERFANACVTNLATVDDVVSVDANLMAQDRVVITSHLRFQTFDGSRTKTNQLIFQIIVALFPKLRRRLQQFGFSTETLRFFVAEVVVKCFQLGVFEVLSFGRRAIVRRHVDAHFFLLLRFGLPAVTFFRGAVSSLDVVVDDSETATLVLKWIGDRVEFSLDGCHFGVDLFYLRVDFGASGFLCLIELFVLRTLPDLRVALSRVGLDAVEIVCVAADEFLLHSLPGTLSERLVVKRPGNGERHQQRTNQHPAAG